MLPYAVNGFSICGLPSYVQSMAPLYAVLLPSGNAFRSTSLSFLPQWATLSNQCNSASKLKSTNPIRAISTPNRPLNSIHSAFKCNLNSASKCNLNSASKSNAFSMWATPSNPNLNSAFKSNAQFSIRPLNSIHSAFKCNLNSASKCNLNSASKCNLNSAMFTFLSKSANHSAVELFS